MTPQRTTTSYSPWTLNVATAKRYGYPIVHPTRIDLLEARVQALEDAQALHDGLAVLDGAS